MGGKQWLIFPVLISNVIVFGLSGCAVPKEKEFITDVSFTTAINLSGEWRFKKIEFIDESMVQPEYDDSNWLTVQVPATWQQQGIEWGIWDIPLVLYRRTLTIPAEWEGQPIGISCWFSKQSVVYVNGTKVEPKGSLFARYSDISKLLRYRKTNYIAVTAAHYGWGVTEPWFDFADELARQGYISLILGATTPRLEHILNAVDYLSMLDFIDSARIGVIGANMAAKFSIVAASRDRRIKMVISMSSPMVKFDEKVSLCPVLLIVSESDPNAVIYAKNISKELIGPTELLVFKGKVHGITFIEDKWTATRQTIVGWLRKYL